MRHCVYAWDCHEFGPIEALLIMITIILLFVAMRRLM